VEFLALVLESRVCWQSIRKLSLKLSILAQPKQWPPKHCPLLYDSVAKSKAVFCKYYIVIALLIINNKIITHEFKSSVAEPVVVEGEPVVVAAVVMEPEMVGVEVTLVTVNPLEIETVVGTLVRTVVGTVVRTVVRIVVETVVGTVVRTVVRTVVESTTVVASASEAAVVAARVVAAGVVAATVVAAGVVAGVVVAAVVAAGVVAAAVVAAGVVAAGVVAAAVVTAVVSTAVVASAAVVAAVVAVTVVVVVSDGVEAAVVISGVVDVAVVVGHSGRHRRLYSASSQDTDINSQEGLGLLDIETPEFSATPSTTRLQSMRLL
jgi:hypothetical protein